MFLVNDRLVWRDKTVPRALELKITQRVTMLQTVLNQEVTLKRLIGMLSIAQKLYVGAKLIYVSCINCSNNNVAKGDRPLDKKTFFVYIGKISCK